MTKELTQQNISDLKKSDATEYIPLNGLYYRAGTNGLSFHKKDKYLTKIGHCNDFRNKDLRAINSELAIKI